MTRISEWEHAGRRVATKRIALGLNQYELADQLGVPVLQISQVERGLVPADYAVRVWLDDGEAPLLGEESRLQSLKDRVLELEKSRAFLLGVIEGLMVRLAALERRAEGDLP